MHKNERHHVILDLINAEPIARQDELARRLTERGFSVTQASVSRDLEKLGVSKINGRYVRQSFGAHFGAYGPVSYSEAGDNLIVLKCGAGLASAAAVRIDAAAIRGIVGTIAGDDTIFIAVEGERDQPDVIRALRKILETNEGNEQN